MSKVQCPKPNGQSPMCPMFHVHFTWSSFDLVTHRRDGDFRHWTLDFGHGRANSFTSAILLTIPLLICKLCSDHPFQVGFVPGTPPSKFSFKFSNLRH